MSDPMMPDNDSDQRPQPPHDLAAEQSALGAALLSSDALAELASLLPSSVDFYRPAHQAIYQACLELFNDSNPVDPITVAAELERRGQLTRIGGAPYLHTLIATVPTATNAAYYAELVVAKAKLRRLGEVGQHIAQTAEHGNRAGEADVDALLATAQQALDGVNTRPAASVDDFDTMTHSALDYIESIQSGDADLNAVFTGLSDLDELTGGFRPGQLITVGARPGVGKSVLGVEVLRHAALHRGQTGVLFSLEMGKNEIMTRVISAESKVRLQDLRRKGGMDDNDWARVGKKVDELQGASLLVDDSPGMTITEIKARARTLAQRNELRLIVVDYLQLLTPSKRADNREQEVAEFSRQLKLIAKELDVPVVAISQLNRGSEQRADKRPMMGDLRESGAVEQDSDLVILLDRPDAREQDDPRLGEMDLILAKHRDGPIATVTVAHQLHYSRLANLTAE